MACRTSSKRVDLENMSTLRFIRTRTTRVDVLVAGLLPDRQQLKQNYELARQLSAQESKLKRAVGETHMWSLR
jgi:hypothetical protein